MNPVKRKAKQTSITAIYLLIIFLIGISLFLHFKPNPSCSDGKQNQGEKGIDCGGPCPPCAGIGELKELKILSTDLAHDINNKYDLAIKIENPNQETGAEKISFDVKILGENNTQLAKTKISGKFILPGEAKYIFLTGLELPSQPVKAQTQVADIQWNENIKLDDPRLVVLNKHYQKESGGSPYFAKATGTLINRSNADFNVVKVKVLLHDTEGKLLAINHQLINTLRSGEKRDFIILFPHSFSGAVSSLEVFPETNIYSKDNYLNPQHYIDYQEKEIEYE